MSINKIHVNSSTNISLNDRFTKIQSAGQNIAKSIAKKISQRRTNNGGRSTPPKGSFENVKFLQRLEQKHKIQTALKLKRVWIKFNLSLINFDNNFDTNF